MSIDDIKNKWLFVAYSAKKQGIEDQELDEKEYDSYRDKIQSKKFFAGAKGIGRFSCDRLGSKLILTTKTASSQSKVEQIEVNWKDFEKDPEEKFIDIPVKHRTIQPFSKELKKFKHGTILEVSNLNSNWDRDKKLNLKYSLEKLINPFEDNPLNGFSIIIEDEIEKTSDDKEKNKRNRVNGEVKNFVFETLGLKTTQIETEITPDGKFIITSLWDRETLIYKIRKKNNSVPQLRDIKFHLFHLNRIAKYNFTRIMGIEPVYFGSVFVYKNGFRVAPYGDLGFDYFSLDSRKGQKHFERLGTRDLIGRIEIMGSNPHFMEISSRDGGLVRNEHYHAMVKYFIFQCLEKLEHYLKNVSWTSKEDKDREDLSALNNIYAKSALLNLISDEIDEKGTELLDTDRTNLSIRTHELLKIATEKDIEALKVISSKLGDKAFSIETQKTEKEHKRELMLSARLASEEEARLKAEAEKEKLENALALEKEKNTYFMSSNRNLSEDAKGLVHNIKLTSKIINSNVDTLIEKIKNKEIKEADILKRLGIIKFNAEKALKISNLITRANFKTQADNQVLDIAKLIEQYLGVYSEIYDDNQIKFEVENNNASLIRKINVLDISMMLDDLISNSQKADAKKILVELFNTNKNTLKVLFSDNGKGVPSKFIGNSNELFELGVTTTDGSGIGLNSIKKILLSIKSSIAFVGNNKKLKGATFEIVFKND